MRPEKSISDRYHSDRYRVYKNKNINLVLTHFVCVWNPENGEVAHLPNYQTDKIDRWNQYLSNREVHGLEFESIFKKLNI